MKTVTVKATILITVEMPNDDDSELANDINIECMHCNDAYSVTGVSVYDSAIV